MAEYPTQPCAPWVTGADLSGCTTADSTVRGEAAAVASDLLYYLSGMQYPGVCSYVVRPGYRKCDCGRMWCGLPWVPNYFPYATSFVCCDTGRARLGFSPIVSVLSVELDGVLLSAAEYQVDEFVELVRVSPSGVGWPTDDTWEVEFTAGVAPPPSGIMAAKVLGCELAKAAMGDSNCALPSRITQLTRQGVTAVYDDMAFLAEGRTGMYAVDLFLATHNPDNLHSSATVAIPNQPVQVIRNTGV